MNRFDLGNKIYSVFLELSQLDGDERSQIDILQEIYDHLEYKEGIDEEIDYVRQTFDLFKDTNSKEYQMLDDLWNDLNYYKSDFEGATRIIDLLYKWVGTNYGSQEETEPSYDLISLGIYLKKELEHDKSK